MDLQQQQQQLQHGIRCVCPAYAAAAAAILGFGCSWQVVNLQALRLHV
jgi:hypothetical protein